MLERDVLALMLGGTKLERVLAALAAGLEQITGTGLVGVGAHRRERAHPPRRGAFLAQGLVRPDRRRAHRRQGRLVRHRGLPERAGHRVPTSRPTRCGSTIATSARPFGPARLLVAADRVDDGDVLGTVALYYCEPRAPSPDELDAISGAARVARIALERHRDEKIREGLVHELRETLHDNEILIGILGHDLRNPLSAIYRRAPGLA